jgi:hypothetical protein
MIHDEIQHLAVDISEVRPWHKNARQGDVGLLSESLRLNGQYKPIIVQKATGKIVAGNHTWRAARALKWGKIAVQFLDVSDSDAEKIVLVDNRTSDVATYDYNILKEQLSLLPDLAGTGYTLEDIQTLGELVDEPLDLGKGSEHKSQMLSATLYFDSETQQAAWQQFLGWIRENREGSTDTAKITAFVLEAMSD